MSCTDILQLNKTKMFAKIREGLPALQQLRTQNILDVSDDLLFVWDKGESSLLAFNWRAAHVDGHETVLYQTLTPSSTQNFEVEKVLVSNSCSLVALAGPKGVTIIELPIRFGKHNLFNNGKEKILCRSTNLCARFFHNNPHLEVRQIQWHPASPTDSHLLVLLSDNTIRVYDGSSLLYVWQVGPISLKTDVNPNSSTLMALGESVVDFDFAPQVEVEANDDDESANNLSRTFERTNISIKNLSLSERSLKSSKEDQDSIKTPQRKPKKIVWPIVLLRENGNIYIMMTDFQCRRPRLQGPLAVTPSAHDNYGLESCSLIVIPSLPPTLVIAESNGRLHHALLLDLEEPENSFNEVDETLLIEPAEWMLHIFETVELELGLPKSNETERNFNCPVHLRRDFVSDMRYFAYHNAGFHAVTIYFLSELHRFVESDVTTDLTQVYTPSSVEYILCTKINSQENKVNAVLGFAPHEMPAGLIALLGSGQGITLKLIINPKMLVQTHTLGNEVPALFSKDHNRFDKNDEPSFAEHIENLLKRDTSQPIISVDRNLKLSNAESFEFLKQTIDVLRTHYLNKHQIVLSEFIKKMSTILLREQQQKGEIEFLEKQIEQIKDNAHKMAEKFEEINERQELYTKRCLNLIRESKSRIPVDSVSELNFIKNVERINKTVKNMQKSLQTCKETINRQKYHVSKSINKDPKKKFQLPERHELTIKEILTSLGSEIEAQINEVKVLDRMVAH